jgi:hypothetical protein
MPEDPWETGVDDAPPPPAFLDIDALRKRQR